MNSMNQSTTCVSFIVAVALTCFVLLPNAPAVSLPPDGGYPGLNTAEGQHALFDLNTGVANTAVGWLSLESNTDGSFNTAVSAGTLALNVGDQTGGFGIDNTAVGAAALFSNTTGFANTANGSFALSSNGAGNNNIALGRNVLANSTAGSSNTAVDVVRCLAIS